MNSEFIEIIGEGEYQERIEKYILDLKLEVRASDEETALKEVLKLKDETVLLLKKSGLSIENIIDGGYELWKPWNRKKKTGKYAHYKIIIQTKDENILSKSIEKISVLFQNQRHSLTYEMRQPQYDNPIELEKDAIKTAYKNALNKAKAIAEESNVEIGRLLQVNELSKSKRNSGIYGDEDWMGDNSRFGGYVGGISVAGGGYEEPDSTTSKAERTIWVRYKFRFEITARLV